MFWINADMILQDSNVIKLVSNDMIAKGFVNYPVLQKFHRLNKKATEILATVLIY